MHVYTSYPLGTAEAHSRWYSYPPPYWYNNGWYYATPWLWIDGDKRGSYSYSQWSTKIATRMAVPSSFTTTMWGDWIPAEGTGTVYTQFRNDSNDPLTGNVILVVVEDSIYQPAPNGDLWHNNVARDYIPDWIGDEVTIPAGDSVTVSYDFTLGTTWNSEKIQFFAFIQDTALQPDTIIEVWQGAKLDITELGVAEYGNASVAGISITPTPNPCVNGTRFSFTLPNGERYQINFFDITGRKIRTLNGVASGNEEAVEWNLRNVNDARVSAGVYLYRFESNSVYTTGKVVVR
ncbi:MAG: Omp28-related outer membrane protein [candidate division WOR-3 bacterium]|nr:MAG: Omp28-related outer membrane protein [candidate division WOR-3 bacterium]